jgi:GTPase SAR1 family protein
VSAIQRIGDTNPPKLIETLRIGAVSVLSVLIALSAAADGTATKASNIKSLIMLMVSSSMASYALLDAVKPDNEKDARKALNLVKAEADVIVAEATEYWARMNPSAFTRGELPSDAFIDTFARNLVQEEGDLLALPSSEVAAFEPETLMQPELEYEEIKVAQTPKLERQTIQHTSKVSFSGNQESWLDTLINPSVLLIYGADGSGKTSLAVELIKRRNAQGHQCIALDPHGEPDKWPDCEVIGHGLAFDKVEQAIDKLQIVIKDRYEQIGTGEVKPCQFPPITFVCEELTDWSGSVSNADLLIRKAGNYRKVNVCLLLVSHGDKLSQIGAPKGFANVADNVLTKLQLFSKPSPSGKPVPAMKGTLTRPSGKPEQVIVPKFDTTVKVPQKSAQTFTEELPKVERYSNANQGFEYTEPHILELLKQRQDFKAVITYCVNAGGKLDALSIANEAKSNTALQTENGVSFNSDMVRNRFKFLVKYYPRSFELLDNGLSLRVLDPCLLAPTDA